MWFPVACSTKRDKQTQSCRVSFELTKSGSAGSQSSKETFSDNSEFEPEFVINSGAGAPERVTRAANSQSHGTWRASAKHQLDSLLARVSAMHFPAED